MVVSPSTASCWLCLQNDGGSSRSKTSWFLASFSPPTTPFPWRRPSPTTSSAAAPLPRRADAPVKTKRLLAALLHSHLLAAATSIAPGQVDKSGLPFLDQHAHLLHPAGGAGARDEGEARQASKACTKAPPAASLCFHQVRILLTTHVNSSIEQIYPRVQVYSLYNLMVEVRHTATIRSTGQKYFIVLFRLCLIFDRM